MTLTKFSNDNLEDVYSVYAYSYLKFICNGLMGEHDMYFVDTKYVIRILDVEIIGPHNFERRSFTDNKSYIEMCLSRSQSLFPADILFSSLKPGG